MTHQKQSYSRAPAAADNGDGDIVVFVEPQYKMKQVQYKYAAAT